MWHFLHSYFFVQEYCGYLPRKDQVQKFFLSNLQFVNAEIKHHLLLILCTLRKWTNITFQYPLLQFRNCILWSDVVIATCPLFPASGSLAKTRAIRRPTGLSSEMLTEESEVMSNCGLLSFSSNMVIVTCQVEEILNNTFGRPALHRNKWWQANNGLFKASSYIYCSRTQVGPEIYKLVSWICDLHHS